ncbi:DUF440 family protein [Xanthomonas sacchari]|uniref:DUF440 family protein n=1 Tax=Xanthomonas sacchari TaxID=56458 RepID=UPI0031C8E06D|nr:DUF440 family protein [Xanthomonas campestris pv. cannae]
MTYLYARRTYDEAIELARSAFRASAADHLTLAELAELEAHGLLTGGTPGPDWEQITSVVPTEHQFYELQIYKPSDAKPHIERFYVRMLVPRDRSSEAVQFMWRPPVERT